MSAPQPTSNEQQSTARKEMKRIECGMCNKKWMSKNVRVFFVTIHCLVYTRLFCAQTFQANICGTNKKKQISEMFSCLLFSNETSIRVSLAHQLCSMIIPIWCEVCMLLVILISFALNSHLILNMLHNSRPCPLFTVHSEHCGVYVLFVYYVCHWSLTFLPLVLSNWSSSFYKSFIIPGCSKICSVARILFQFNCGSSF